MDKITSINHSRRDQSFAPSGFLGGTRVVGGACTARVCTPRRPPRLVAIVVVAIVVVVVVIVVAIPRRRAIRAGTRPARAGEAVEDAGSDIWKGSSTGRDSRWGGQSRSRVGGVRVLRVVGACRSHRRQCLVGATIHPTSVCSCAEGVCLRREGREGRACMHACMNECGRAGDVVGRSSSSEGVASTSAGDGEAKELQTAAEKGGAQGGHDVYVSVL